uniref:Reverse transcriptase domain-containing protein n=1 Tax=Tanacetum cinerariifolium TaxID=118510 RepID=A0A6L2LGS0_TANCI|nr:hypothetical protein [Tanacetum cinerariifolium]
MPSSTTSATTWLTRSHHVAYTWYEVRGLRSEPMIGAGTRYEGPCYNQNFGYDQPPYYSPSQPQQCYCCEVYGCPHYSSDCQTRNPLVYEPNSCNNYDFPYFDQPPQYSPPLDLYFQKSVDDFKLQIDEITESILRRVMPNPPVILIDTDESDDVTEVIFYEDQFLRQQSTTHVTPPLLKYTPPPAFLATMEPLDTLLMGDEVISTTPARENDEIIKSSVDDPVLILRESEVSLVSTDLECSMPIDSPPFPCIDDLRDAKVDINLPFGGPLDTFSTRDREIDFNTSDLETIDPVPDLMMFDIPLGNDDSISRSFDVTI